MLSSSGSEANCKLLYSIYIYMYLYTHTHTFNDPFSVTTQVSRYQKVKPVWILLKQETVSGSGISWAICKSAPHSRQITTSASHRSVFYRPYALPATQTTACEGNSKYWLQLEKNYSNALLNQQLTPYRWNILPFMLSLWLKYPKYPMKLIHYNKI